VVEEVTIIVEEVALEGAEVKGVVDVEVKDKAL
jgi:hypothetical protein